MKMMSHADRRVNLLHRGSLDGPKVASGESKNGAIVMVGAADAGEGACRRTR